MIKKEHCINNLAGSTADSESTILLWAIISSPPLVQIWVVSHGCGGGGRINGCLCKSLQKLTADRERRVIRPSPLVETGIQTARPCLPQLPNNWSMGIVTSRKRKTQVMWLTSQEVTSCGIIIRKIGCDSTPLYYCWVLFVGCCYNVISQCFLKKSMKVYFKREWQHQSSNVLVLGWKQRPNINNMNECHKTTIPISSIAHQIFVLLFIF